VDANSPDAERHGPASEVALAGEHERKVMALREALIEGVNSGEVGELDLGNIKAKARKRSSS